MATRELAAKLAKQRENHNEDPPDDPIINHLEIKETPKPITIEQLIEKPTNSATNNSKNNIQPDDRRPVVHLAESWHKKGRKAPLAKPEQSDMDFIDDHPSPPPQIQLVQTTPVNGAKQPPTGDKRPVVHVGSANKPKTVTSKNQDIIAASKHPSASSAHHVSSAVPKQHRHLTISICTEFNDFSRKQLQQYHSSFEKFDVNQDEFIDFEELKLMMENMGQAQTHLALKEMIAEVDEDHDNKINFREFLLIFRKAAAGELKESSAWNWVDWAKMDCVDVTKEGVHGAKNFFEAKIEQLIHGSEFEEEIRKEQEERREREEADRLRKEQFKEAKSMFH